MTTLVTGCPDNNAEPPAPVCLEAGVIDTACAAAYTPTYDELYTRTLQPTCAKSGASCHASTGKQGGLDFSDKEAVYAAMLKNNVARAGQPECSSVVQRVIATDGLVRMPPGANIPAGEQCALIQWIANGAKR